MTPDYRTRRLFALWLPLVLVGAVTYAAASIMNPLFNGLTLVGTVLVFSGIGAAALDSRSER